MEVADPRVVTTHVLTAGTAAKAADTHLHNWDRLRVLASLDILGSHLTGTHLLGGVGLPVFLMLSIALAVQRPVAGDPDGFIRKRLTRVVVPWVFWSVVIADELTVRAAASGEPLFGWARANMLLYGPEIHLWFLPFSAAASIAAFGLQRAVPASLPRTAAYLAFVIGALALGLCPIFERGWPIEQWGFSLPAVCIGFGVGRLLSSDSDHRTVRLELALWAAAFAVIGSLLARSSLEVAPYAERHVGAILLLAGALWLPNLPDPLTRRLVPSLLGVYILHLFVFREVVEPLRHAFDVELGGQLRVGLDFVLTVAVVSLLRQTPLRRVL